MQTAIKQTVTVREGGLIEVRSPELRPGAKAEVIVLLEGPEVDFSTEWSDEDMRDITRYSLQRAAASVDEE